MDSRVEMRGGQHEWGKPSQGVGVCFQPGKAYSIRDVRLATWSIHLLHHANARRAFFVPALRQGRSGGWVGSVFLARVGMAVEDAHIQHR